MGWTVCWVNYMGTGVSRGLDWSVHWLLVIRSVADSAWYCLYFRLVHWYRYWTQRWSRPNIWLIVKNIILWWVLILRMQGSPVCASCVLLDSWPFPRSLWPDSRGRHILGSGLVHETVLTVGLIQQFVIFLEFGVNDCLELFPERYELPCLLS